MLVSLVGGICYNAVEMGSGAVIYVPSFIKIDSDIQKLIKGNTLTYRQTQTER
jgi:hypothetical protein